MRISQKISALLQQMKHIVSLNGEEISESCMLFSKSFVHPQYLIVLPCPRQYSRNLSQNPLRKADLHFHQSPKPQRCNSSLPHHLRDVLKISKGSSLGRLVGRVKSDRRLWIFQLKLAQASTLSHIKYLELLQYVYTLNLLCICSY